tara:strand:+ start:1713 stop:2975 length:1263 start_codon:yes stop_codon:yes gene_type:complete
VWQFGSLRLWSDKLKIDKEFKSLIPPLGREELLQLEENIKQDGCRDPLVVWGDILVDGHNRFDICTRNEIKFKTVSHKFNDRTEAIIWIIDNQFGRRNLADIDRIALARKREEVLRPIAKENLRTPTGGRGLTSAKLPESKPPIDTRKESAKTAGVGERTYDAGKLILDAAASGEISQEVVEEVRRKEKSIHRVAKDIKESRQKSNRDEKRKEAAQAAEQESPQFFDNVHIGDFRLNADKVRDGSVSLIFTDPPYDKKAEELFEGLADFAMNKLAEGGSLVMYLGHLQLRSALNAFDGKLRHWWTCACVHDGGKTLMREYGIRVGWKPMLWFVKGTRHDKQKIISDVVSGATEKTHHDWQQDQSEAEYWIESLCPVDGIVCDTFLGGGTTAAAAMKLRRKWVGFEIDHDQAVIAMARCKQ